MLDRFNTMLVALYARLQAEEGQTMAEYALVLALIVAVTAAVFTGLGTHIKAQLNGVCHLMDSSSTSC
jgi:Flp pilus assembly pilin Flp